VNRRFTLELRTALDPFVPPFQRRSQWIWRRRFDQKAYERELVPPDSPICLRGCWLAATRDSQSVVDSAYGVFDPRIGLPSTCSGDGRTPFEEAMDVSDQTSALTYNRPGFVSSRRRARRYCRAVQLYGSLPRLRSILSRYPDHPRLRRPSDAFPCLCMAWPLSRVTMDCWSAALLVPVRWTRRSFNSGLKQPAVTDLGDANPPNHQPAPSSGPWRMGTSEPKQERRRKGLRSRGGVWVPGKD